MGKCTSKLKRRNTSNRELHPTFMSQQERIKHEWNKADKNRDNSLSLKEIKDLLLRLNIHISKKLLQETFDKYDKDDNRTLDFEEFTEFFKQLSSIPNVKSFFDSATGGYAETMSAAELRQFLISNGNPSLSENDCAALIVKVEMGEGNAEDVTGVSPDQIYLSPRGFAQILSDWELNSVFETTKIKSVYQDMTKPLSHYFINASHNTYLSGNQFNDKSSLHAIAHALRHGVRVIELDAWDGDDSEPMVTHGHAFCSSILFRDCIAEIKENGFVASEYPVIITIENHCSPAQQIVQANILKEVLGELLFQWEGETTDDGKSDWRIPPKNWLSPEDLKKKVVIRSKPKESKPSQITKENVDKIIATAKEDELEEETEADDTLDENEVDELRKLMYIKNVKTKPVILDDGSAVTYPVRDGVTSSSFKETKMMELAQPGVRVRDLSVYARENLVRVYPKGTRIASSNYNPVFAWNAGCQIVALNYQTKTMPVWLNDGKFRDNGASGYVLKPEQMYQDDPLWDASSETLKPLKLNITLFSGHYLPKPEGQKDNTEVIDPYVITQLHSLSNVQTDKTQVVPNNGFNPVWNHDMTFEVHAKELDLLSFVVMDKDRSSKDDFIGHQVIPISVMRTGLRVIPLLGSNGDPIPHAYLFASIKLSN